MKMTTPNESGMFRKSLHEKITPHKLTIAILIRNYANFREMDGFSSLEDEVVKTKLRRDFCVLTLKLLQSPDLALAELRNVLVSTKYNVHEGIIDSFDETLHTIYTTGTGAMLDVIDGLNRVMTFNETLSAPEPTCTISKSSIVGYYIRRLIVNFQELTFSEVTSVFLSFKRYYEEWRVFVNSNNQIAVEVDKVMCPDDWSANRNQWSRRQAELFIATQTALITNNEEKALSPIELQNRISNLLTSNPSLSEAHFLSYLNYLRVREFCGAIDSLFHCFDKSTLTEGKGPLEDKSKVYRFAALNLAVLHYHFGHEAEAMASLKEAIRISQAANDNICLQHALSWFYRLTNSTVKEKLIRHSISRSLMLDLNYISSLGIQTFVQTACMISGNPLHIFEALTESDLLDCQNNIRDLTANSYSAKAALWQFYGKSEMSSLWSQLLFHLNIDNLNETKAFSGEGFCLAICNLSNHLLLQGDYSLVHTILSFAKERFPNEPNSHIWMLCENLFVFVRSLHHENWKEAEAAAQKITIVDKFEGYFRLAELAFYKEDFVEAERIIELIIERYESHDKYKNCVYQYLKAKILLAEVQFASALPDKVPSRIMTLLNVCLIETEKYNMDYQSSMIELHLAHIQLSLGMVKLALRMLKRCLIQILAHGGNFDRARAMLLYVKCLIADSKDRENLLNALEMLDKVADNFKAVEAFSRVKDVLYLQAQLYHFLGLKTERNRCALEFRLLEQEKVTKNYHTLVKYL